MKTSIELFGTTLFSDNSRMWTFGPKILGISWNDLQIQPLLILATKDYQAALWYLKLRSDMGCLDVGLVYQSSVVQDFLQRGVMSMEEAKLCLLHAFSPQPFLDRNVPCSNLPELLWRSSLLTLTTLTLKEESWCRFLCDTHPLHRLSLRINTMQERK